MSVKAALALTCSAILAIIVWPIFYAKSSQAPAASFTPAPLVRDYLRRDAVIAFYEHEAKQDPEDQITMRMLAQYYLQRFREQYDLGDIARAENYANQSIRLQPQGNTAAQMTLAGAYLSYHQFPQALKHERDAYLGEPWNQTALAQIASLLMEMGRYREAAADLAAIKNGPDDDPTVDAVRARYDELTGHLDTARALIETGMRTADSNMDDPAYDRSWFHMRAAQLAYEAGDFDAAQRQFAISIAMFPDNAMALMFQARMFRAQGRWTETLDAATRASDLYPLPQALGYKADAERALGDDKGAARTDALIGAEERIFDSQGINDRLLANYYAQRRMRLPEALKAARDDYHKRGNEVYADDTMAWVLAAMGRWNEADHYAQRAARLGTQDSEIQYHAAIIALHLHRPQEARERLRAALSLNPSFDPFDAPDARAQLARLRS